jgi:DNA repair protein RadA/Sms
VALAVASAARGVTLAGAPAGRSPGPAEDHRGLAAGARRSSGGAAADVVPVACFGEVGLTGELRSVAHADRRLAEASKFGLRPVIAPPEVASLREALRAALPRQPAARAA